MTHFKGSVCTFWPDLCISKILPIDTVISVYTQFNKHCLVSLTLKWFYFSLSLPLSLNSHLDVGAQQQCPHPLALAAILHHHILKEAWFGQSSCPTKQFLFRLTTGVTKRTNKKADVSVVHWSGQGEGKKALHSILGKL